MLCSTHCDYVSIKFSSGLALYFHLVQASLFCLSKSLRFTLLQWNWISLQHIPSAVDSFLHQEIQDCCGTKRFISVANKSVTESYSEPVNKVHRATTCFNMISNFQSTE
jgi:hypothetical protein